MGKLSSRVAKLEGAGAPEPLVILVNYPEREGKPFAGFIARWQGGGVETYRGSDREAVKSEIRREAQRRNPQGITVIRLEPLAEFCQP